MHLLDTPTTRTQASNGVKRLGGSPREAGSLFLSLWYPDTLQRWEAEQTDPLTRSFCEAERHPLAIAD
jgi:hypothetical protein